MHYTFGNMTLWMWITRTAKCRQYFHADYWEVWVSLGGEDVIAKELTIQKCYEDIRNKIEKSHYLFHAFANLSL